MYRMYTKNPLPLAIYAIKEDRGLSMEQGKICHLWKVIFHELELATFKQEVKSFAEILSFILTINAKDCLHTYNINKKAARDGQKTNKINNHF